MKGRILFTASAAAAIVILLLAALWFYPNNLQQENHDGSVDTATGMAIIFSNFTLVEFERSNFDSSQVPEIQEKVCGQVVRSDWLPEKVVFAHLEPTKTVYRMPCSIDPAGLYYHYFYETSTAGDVAIVEFDNPNAQQSSLFTIESPLQAAEYVMLFQIVRGGGLGIYHFAITDSEYEQLIERCNESGGGSNSPSPTKGLSVSNSGNQLYTVKINVLVDINGEVVYYEYSVTPSGHVEMLDTRLIVQCGYAI